MAFGSEIKAKIKPTTEFFDIIRELTHKISDEGWITNVGSLSIINKSSATADAVSVVPEIANAGAVLSGEVPPVAANVTAYAPDVAGTDVIVPVTVAVSEAPVATAE